MCKTIKQKVTFKASPKEIYQVLADSRKHSLVTGRRASIGKSVGDPFTTFGGYTRGVIVDLKPNRRIVQAWRTTDFPEGVFSMAAFTLSATASGGTELILTHRGVPKELIPEVEKRWRTFYWEKIKNFLRAA